MAKIISRNDTLELVNGKVQKTSTVTSEMSMEELGKYLTNLKQHAEVAKIERDSIAAEIAQIEKLLGVSK